MLVDIAVVALVAGRVWRLAARDTILDDPRDWILGRTPAIVTDWLHCAWCSGTWLTLLLALALHGWTLHAVLVGAAAGWLVGVSADWT